MKTFSFPKINMAFKPLFLLILVVLTSCNSHQTKITDLKCEYLNQPLGIDSPAPRFSWKIVSEQRGIYQASYQIIVSENKNEIDKKKGNAWDSGEIKSGNTINIVYEGSPLKSNMDYYWRVYIKTEEGQEIWSEAAFFHTGLFSPSEWKANWITTSEEIADKSPVFRKDFEIHKKIKKAYSYVTACGFYEFFLNGEKVGDHVMDPSVTDYRKRILYATYDVTKQLKQGANSAGIMLGNGACNLRHTKGRFSWSGNSSIGKPCFIVQLHISYEDGSSELVLSDDSWKYANGPISFNNLFGGEDYNALLEMNGWNNISFDDESWKNAVTAETPGGKPESQLVPPVKIAETISPVARTNPSKGVYLFDLGQNIAGWWKVQVKGTKGQTIRIRGSETLNNEQFPKNLEEGDRMSEKHSYHSNVWTDYTLKGSENETYEPRFFYSGFRYIEVATSDKEALEDIRVEGRVIHSANERNGSFNSSNELLNKIYQAGLWSQKGNTVFYPTDCPHREKGAYNGDGQVIAETSIHDFQMAAFYTKWVADMRDSQKENGRIPNTSPVLVGGSGGGVAWGSAYILIPYWMNHYYNDQRILEEHYPTMKKYILYLKKQAKTDKNPEEDYIINDFMTYWYSLGEWCTPGENDGPNHPVVSTFYYYYNTKLMAEIASILGKTDDSMQFSALSDTIKLEFNKKFFNKETFLYGTDSTYQTYQLLALMGDIIPQEYRAGVLQTIVKDIEKRDNHLHTGILGTKYLWPVLVTEGYSELAFRIATQESYPGYGYWLNNNSTTLLEHWSGKNSHNHEMFGSIVEYFYKYLAGIQSPVEGKTSKGYSDIHLQPYVPSELEMVNASVETVSGKIVSHWEKQNDNFIYSVSVPANTKATVVLPETLNPEFTLTESNKTIWDGNNFIPGVSGIENVDIQEDQIIIHIESGTYNFRLLEL